MLFRSGDVASGSKQTFTGKSCSVSSGDILGIYPATGRVGVITGSAGNAYLWREGSSFSGGDLSYTQTGDTTRLCIYATGSTETGWSHITKVDGVTASGAAKKDGIAVGSVAKINGVAV